MEFNIGAMKAEAMRKAFGIDIEKGRTGVYEDNAENRRLNRVGQQYGHKKEEEQKTVKTSKKTEQEQKTSAATMESAAQGASDGALKRASQDPKAPADVKAAAKKELENRGGGEEKKEEKKTPYQKKSETKSGEEIFNSFDKKKQKELLKIFQDETAQSGYEGDEAVEVISEYLEGGDFTEAEDIAQNYGISWKEANNLVSHLLKLEIDRIKQSGYDKELDVDFAKIKKHAGDFKDSDIKAVLDEFKRIGGKSDDLMLRRFYGRNLDSMLQWGKALIQEFVQEMKGVKKKDAKNILLGAMLVKNFEDYDETEDTEDFEEGKISINSISGKDIENMSYNKFEKKFNKEVNGFLRKLEDSKIDKIGYLKKTDGSYSDIIGRNLYVEGSDKTIEVFVNTNEDGTKSWAMSFGKSSEDEEGFEDDSDKELYYEDKKKFKTAKEAVDAMHERLKKIKNGEDIKFEIL